MLNATTITNNVQAVAKVFGSSYEIAVLIVTPAVVSFDGKKVFLDAFEKWRKIFKHSRKKEFKFSNLVKYMQTKNMSELEQKK